MRGIPMLELRIRTEKDHAIHLSVSGEIDLTNAAEIATTAISAAPGGREMVLDLSGVEYFDTSGVRMLLNVKETLGERLTLIPGRRVLKILTIIGVLGQFRLRVDTTTKPTLELSRRRHA